MGRDESWLLYFQVVSSPHVFFFCPPFWVRITIRSQLVILFYLFKLYAKLQFGYSKGTITAAREKCLEGMGAQQLAAIQQISDLAFKFGGP